jgi:TPR repeat protein
MHYPSLLVDKRFKPYENYQFNSVATRQAVHTLCKLEVDQSVVNEYLRLEESNNHKDAAFFCAEIISKQETNSSQEIALPYYKIAAEAGHSEAKLKYLMITAEKLKSHSLFMSYEEKQACAESAWQLGRAYFYGNTFDNKLQLTYQEAVNYLKLAADQDHAQAAYILVDLLERELYFEKAGWINLKGSKEPDPGICDEINKYHLIAVRQGYYPAVLEDQVGNGKDINGNIAWLLYQEFSSGNSYSGFVKNEKKALICLRKAMDLKHIEALETGAKLTNSNLEKGQYLLVMNLVKKKQENNSGNELAKVNQKHAASKTNESTWISEKIEKAYEAVTEVVDDVCMTFEQNCKLMYLKSSTNPINIGLTELEFSLAGYSRVYPPDDFNRGIYAKPTTENQVTFDEFHEILEQTGSTIYSNDVNINDALVSNEEKISNVTNNFSVEMHKEESDYDRAMTCFKVEDVAEEDVTRNLMKGLTYLKQAADSGDGRAIDALESNDPNSPFFNAVWKALDNRAILK